MPEDLRLLVVDDDAAICRACHRVFSRQGFQVDKIRDPFQGLSMAIEGDYAAVLLDIKMPRMDGVQFLEKLRGRKPHVPVVLITGYPSISNATSAVRLDASDYVTKPFTPEEITQAVQRVLARRDTKAEKKAGSVSRGVELWTPRAGEFRFWNESWFQLGKEGSVRAGAMHQRMPDAPMAFEASMRVGAVVTLTQGATVEAVCLPRVGDAVYQGLPLAGLILTGKSQRTVPSPISGVVVAVNPLLRESFWALWEDPCGDGWIACVSPTHFEQDVKNCTLRRVVLANAYETSARSQREELTRLGCQVCVVTKREELGSSVRDSKHNVLVFDAASFGEEGPELVGRVNSAAPSMKVVVIASSGSEWEPAYRERTILYYAIEPFADNEILEILHAAFQPHQQPVSHSEYGKASSEPVSGIRITTCNGHKVHLLASPSLSPERGALGWRIKQKLADRLVPMVTTSGKADISLANIMKTAAKCDRVVVLTAKDIGRLPGTLVRDTKAEFGSVAGEQTGNVTTLEVQPDPSGGGFLALDDRTTEALAEHIVREMASTDNLSNSSRRPEWRHHILRERLDAILSSFEGREPELIPILQRVQAEFSCLRDEAMLAVAQFTGVPESRVFSVATFYEQFHLAPVGKKHVMACRGTSCYLRGAPQILKALEKQLGIKVGQTTKDLEYSLGTIGCTGTCARSPCIMIDDRVESRMTPQKVAKLFGKGARR